MKLPETSIFDELVRREIPLLVDSNNIIGETAESPWLPINS
jgi:hypothetical protein